MSDIRCPKCFREGATWAHVENCEGVQSAIDALKSAPCNICGEVGHLADECPIMSKRIQDIAAKMNFPSCADLRQMLSWAAGLLREHHREEADRIFDYLNRRAGGE